MKWSIPTRCHHLSLITHVDNPTREGCGCNDEGPGFERCRIHGSRGLIVGVA